MTVNARVAAGAATGLQALAEGLTDEVDLVEVPLFVKATALVLEDDVDTLDVELELNVAALNVVLVLSVPDLDVEVVLNP